MKDIIAAITLAMKLKTAERLSLLIKANALLQKEIKKEQAEITLQKKKRIR